MDWLEAPGLTVTTSESAVPGYWKANDVWSTWMDPGLDWPPTVKVTVTIVAVPLAGVMVT